MCGEGQPSDSMFVTMEGSVQVLKRDTTGTEKELAVIPAPSMIGQMGLVDGSARSATCRAASAIKASLSPNKHLTLYCKNNLLKAVPLDTFSSAP